MTKKAQVIAFYLPQFYPIPENDEWWGKGFTEWTNVGKARPLFSGHYQPRVPADLGYYDLRLPIIREQQAELAREAGISAFCYWHYWFGNGKQLLENILQEVVVSGKPDFPFCLGWANHSWERKDWNTEESRLSKKMLIKQEYPGIEDYELHFRTILPVLRDTRYYKIEGKLVFLIFHLEQLPNPEKFIVRWNELAKQEGLPEFFFIAQVRDKHKINNPVFQLCNAINLSLLHEPWGGSKSLIFKIKRRIMNLFFSKRPLSVVSYKKAIKKLVTPLYEKENVFPTIIPNWDHSPRIGNVATIYHNSTPELFKQHVKMVLDTIKNKKQSHQIIFLKSWNEWAEGNYMEPDLKFGKGYVRALREALEEETVKFLS